MNGYRTRAGFTLIELMIVLVVIAVLAGIALPSYREHVRRAARAEAKIILMENAQFMERNFTEAGRYDRDASGASTVLPSTVAPKDGGATNYSITLQAAQTTYALLAAPVAGGLMEGDACGALTLNQLGQKGVSGGSLGVAACWNR